METNRDQPKVKQCKPTKYPVAVDGLVVLVEHLACIVRDPEVCYDCRMGCFMEHLEDLERAVQAVVKALAPRPVLQAA